MTEPSHTLRTARPLHLWAVALLTLALYLLGARDYLAGDTAYMTWQFRPDGVAYFTGYPLALLAIWTINVVGGLVAACLLLALSRWSVPAAVAGGLRRGAGCAAGGDVRVSWTAGRRWVPRRRGSVSVSASSPC